jgi:hypothetical protein
MEVIELIEKSLKFNEEHLKVLVDDIPDKQFATCPGKGIDNHPAWTIGHLFDASEMSCELLGDKNTMPKKWIKLFRRTGPGDPKIPSTNWKDYPGKEELLNRFCESHARQIKLLKNCSPDVLKEKISWSFDASFPTKIELLHFMATWHETGHISQITVWRRAMGLPSSLKPLKHKLKNKS